MSAFSQQGKLVLALQVNLKCCRCTFCSRYRFKRIWKHHPHLFLFATADLQYPLFPLWEGFHTCRDGRSITTRELTWLDCLNSNSISLQLELTPARNWAASARRYVMSFAASITVQIMSLPRPLIWSKTPIRTGSLAFGFSVGLQV